MRAHAPARPIRLLTAAGAALALSGCSAWFNPEQPLIAALTPYRIDIQQGNVVTREQLAQVRPGMSKLQVRDLLGVPLLADPFHTGRWDYIFTYQKPGKPLVRREVVLLFDGDTLKSVEAPELPSEQEFVSSIARSTGGFKSSLLELSPEQLRALPVPPKPAASAPEAPANVSGRSYPPLEPS